ncbi:MAG: DUF4124 domain-containing protein [Rhodocyclales bacterium GT-UBC]|nr:MAG: DUF4124 domain-containing protein [Rhodocyclales bacterium GT-UBC]
MKSSLFFSAGLIACLITPALNAQTYQWKDANGRTIISDTPPPGTAKGSARSLGVPVPNVQTEKPVEKPADAPKTSADKDMEFKKRQQEAKEKAEKDSKDLAATKEKQENCERARRNVSYLESNQPLSTYDEKGERKAMDSSQRDQELERAKRFLAETCK